MCEKKLQQILGTDKRNPCFTIFRNTTEKCLYVYYGGELLEKLPEDRNDPQFKLMVARLYNAGVNATKLRERFSVDFKTMRRWGKALGGGDPEELVRVLAGRLAARKFSVEIQAFTKMRFPHIYNQNKRSYSQEIRAEIFEVFKVNLSSETLRPLLGELITQFKTGDTPCECIPVIEEIHDEITEDSGAFNLNEGAVAEESNRKRSPIFEMQTEVYPRFTHHCGLLLFSHVLQQVEALGGKTGWLMKQWLATLLLGAVNIEQGKLLDFDALGVLLGKTMKSRSPQRRLWVRLIIG